MDLWFPHCGARGPGGGLRLLHVRISLQKGFCCQLGASGPGDRAAPAARAFGTSGQRRPLRHRAQGLGPSSLSPQNAAPFLSHSQCASSLPLSLGHRVLLPGDGLSHGPLLPGPGPSTGSRRCPASQRPPSLPKGRTGASGTSCHADRLVGTNMPPFSAPPPGLCTVCSVLLQVCPCLSTPLSHPPSPTCLFFILLVAT